MDNITSYKKNIDSYFNINKFTLNYDYYKNYKTLDGASSLICNGVSLVRLNYNFNNINELKRFNTLKNNYNITPDKTGAAMLEQYNYFIKKGYSVPVKNYIIKDNYLILENDPGFSYDIKQINRIKKLICKSGDVGGLFIDPHYFQDYGRAICLTGSHGFAFLLPCKVY